MTDFPAIGEIVRVPWGLAEGRGIVRRVHAWPGRPYVRVEMTAELNPDVIFEPVEFTLPLDSLQPETTAV